MTESPKSEEKQQTILVVDDDEELRLALVKSLSKANYRVYAGANFTDGIEILRTQKIDLLLSDLKMPDKSGLDLLKEVKSISSQTRVIIITAYGEMSSYLEAMNIGAFDYINKPINRDELLEMVSRALDLPG
ncbi:MAG: response regulator [Planctomycetota bacterium]|nr:MAG: response regulator [Planctomycetota bacterium]